MYKKPKIGTMSIWNISTFLGLCTTITIGVISLWIFFEFSGIRYN